MRPPFTYYGGKQTLADRIVAFMPDHRHYVEPYAGSLAVLLAKPPAQMETINDLDQGLMTFWKVLRDHPLELERACALTPHSRAEYADCRDHEMTDDPVETARRVWVRLSQGRGGSRASRTGWRQFMDPVGSSLSMPGYIDAYWRRLAPVADRLRSVSLECLPALEIIRRYGGFRDTLLYIDPPYVNSTRSSGRYVHEMTDADHRELAGELQGAKAIVILSGYASALYDELYEGWYRAQIETGTGQGSEWKPRREILWSNRDLNGQMSILPAADLYEAVP